MNSAPKPMQNPLNSQTMAPRVSPLVRTQPTESIHYGEIYPHYESAFREIANHRHTCVPWSILALYPRLGRETGLEPVLKENGPHRIGDVSVMTGDRL